MLQIYAVLLVLDGQKWKNLPAVIADVNGQNPAHEKTGGWQQRHFMCKPPKKKKEASWVCE